MLAEQWGSCLFPINWFLFQANTTFQNTNIVEKNNTKFLASVI